MKHRLILYLAIIFLFSLGVCYYNFFNGFAEDSDSIRLIEAAQQSGELHRLLPSRSWGFPLYEFCLYSILNHSLHGLFWAKCLSLALIILSGLILFVSMRKNAMNESIAFLLTLVFLSNPIIIIAGNTVMETAMNIFFLTVILCFINSFLKRKRIGLELYILYAFILGMATLVRPDNCILFPSLFLLLFIKKKLRYDLMIVSLIVFLLVGILPYFLINYPIFQSLPSSSNRGLTWVIKDVVALFGIPLMIFIAFNLKYLPKGMKLSIMQDEVLLFISINTVLVLVRLFLLPDELEYGVYLWIMFIFLVAKLTSQARFSGFLNKKGMLLLGMCIATFLPNMFQLFFFKEKNFEYFFSPGISAGVFQQEKEMRLYNQAILDQGRSILDAKLIHKNYGVIENVYITFKNCDSCVVLTSVRDFKSQKEYGGRGTNLFKRRLVFAPRFNISRGWRNFIAYRKIPVLTSDQLMLLY